jgi:HD-GYP domain-containing protein (c-di-GMP phosphodiesterase class II)
VADQQNDSGGEARQSYFAKQRLLDTAKLTFQQLSGLLKNVTIYPESHPFLLSLTEKLTLTIDGLLADRKEVAFYFVGGELFFETHSMAVDSTIATLVEQFINRDIGGIVFKPGITGEEFVKLAVLMNTEPSALAAEGGILAVFSRENFAHISIHSVLLVDKKNSSGGAREEDKKRAIKLFMEAIAAIKEMVRTIHLGQAANTRRLNKVIQDLVDNIFDSRDAFVALTNLKMHDEYTYAHCVNTSILAISMGVLMSLEKPQIAALGIAAMMHDVGKIRVPQEIINKTGDITDEEREIFSRHPIDGALIISDIPGIKKIAMVTAFEHHLRGVNAYPRIEGHNVQHLFSQVISLVDAYDVLTALRVYYNIPMPPDQVISALAKMRGVNFNAILMKAFINMIGIFPMGTVLKLSSGEVGLVTHPTNDPMRPSVLLLTKFDGSERESGQEIDLLEKMEGKFKRNITGTIDPQTTNIDVKQYWE